MTYPERSPDSLHLLPPHGIQSGGHLGSTHTQHPWSLAGTPDSSSWAWGPCSMYMVGVDTTDLLS